jgi:SAM-dependent methyltransferase
MRLGLRSYNPIVWALEGFGVLPTPILEAFWGMETSRVIIAGVDLGIFDALDERPRAAADLAHDLVYDEAGVEALLNALTGFGYLRRRRGVYSLKRRTRRWLTRGSRFTVSRPMGLIGVLWEEFGDVEGRVREGGAVDFHRADRDEAFWRRYEIGLGEAAKLNAPSIVRAVRLESPPKTLLDVGGGHGAYSAAFCTRYPDLRVTVLDLPGAAEVGRDLTEDRGLTERVTYVEGDLTTAEWGQGFDVVLIFNVLHVLAPEAAAAAVRKAHDALAPGGTLVVVDAVHDGGAGGRIGAVAGGSELLFYVINGTRAYPEAHIKAWMHEAGLEDVHRKRLLALPEALITARRT